MDLLRLSPIAECHGSLDLYYGCGKQNTFGVSIRYSDRHGHGVVGRSLLGTAGHVRGGIWI